MTIAAAQYDKFKKQIVEEGKVFTFTEDGEYLVFRIHDHEVVPFWSSRRRMETTQQRFPKYRAFQIEEMSLSEFIPWLPKLKKEGIAIGTNWSGKRLIGYDVDAKDLLAGLKYLMAEKPRRRQIRQSRCSSTARGSRRP